MLNTTCNPDVPLHHKLDVRQRRPHKDYYSSSSSHYNRIRNSKSLENFDSPSTVKNSSYEKPSALLDHDDYPSKPQRHSSKTKKSPHYTSELQMHNCHYQKPESHNRRSNKYDEFKTLNKKFSQSTESFTGKSQHVNNKAYYHTTSNSEASRYLYDCYGRLISVPSAQNPYTSSNVNPFVLNEIDVNVVPKQKSYNHTKPSVMQAVGSAAKTPLSKSGIHRNFIGLSESNLLSNHLYTASNNNNSGNTSNFVIPEDDGLVEVNQSSTSIKNK